MDLFNNPLKNRDLIELIASFAHKRNVRVKAQKSSKGALICAASALIGGLLMGPKGLPAGVVLGVVAAYACRGGTIQLLAHVLLNDLSAAQQRMLILILKNEVTGCGSSDLSKLSAEICASDFAQETVLSAAIDFVEIELNMVCIDKKQ